MHVHLYVACGKGSGCANPQGNDCHLNNLYALLLMAIILTLHLCLLSVTAHPYNRCRSDSVRPLFGPWSCRSSWSSKSFSTRFRPVWLCDNANWCHAQALWSHACCSRGIASQICAVGSFSAFGGIHEQSRYWLSLQMLHALQAQIYSIAAAVCGATIEVLEAAFTRVSTWLHWLALRCCVKLCDTANLAPELDSTMQSPCMTIAAHLQIEVLCSWLTVTRYDIHLFMIWSLQ